jgi:hypothetical protein
LENLKRVGDKYWDKKWDKYGNLTAQLSHTVREKAYDS